MLGVLTPVTLGMAPKTFPNVNGEKLGIGSAGGSAPLWDVEPRGGLSDAIAWGSCLTLVISAKWRYWTVGH